MILNVILNFQLLINFISIVEEQISKIKNKMYFTDGFLIVRLSM